MRDAMRWALDPIDVLFTHPNYGPISIVLFVDAPIDAERFRAAHDALFAANPVLASRLDRAPASGAGSRLYLTATGPGAFAPCSGAASHTVSGLAAGNYTFEARATDGFNNVDPTPVKRTVLVVSPPPVIPPPVVHQTTIFQQVIVVTLTFSFHDANKKTTRISALTVNSVPAGSTVSARCPKGCAKKSLVVNNAKGNVSLKALAGKKPLKVKTKITVTVSKPGAVGAVKVLEVQKRKAPTVQSLCLPPGAAKPGRCA